MDWLLSSIDPDRAHEVGALVSWHGRGMVLAWGFVLPFGVLAARFFKIMPGQNWPAEVDNLAWWHAHQIFQYTGLAIVAAALALILNAEGDTPSAGLHRSVGWTVCLFALVQFLSGIFRGSKGGPTDLSGDGSPFGDHYNMTPKRLVFEWLHKFLGYLLLVLALINIVSGLWMTNAPIWMWLGFGCWWFVLIFVFVFLQSQGRAVDTYQALWGPDCKHPGNHRKPIGWGIRRITKDPPQ